MQTAFVTGGAGFLGRNLIEQLVADKWKVVTMDMSNKNPQWFKNLDVQIIEGDITNAPACEASIPENTDAVFHVAGNTSHWKLQDYLQTRINVEGTRNMVNASLKKNVRRFIFTSSIAAYGFQTGRITEKMASSANNFWINYFRTKHLAEREVHKVVRKGLDAVILNPANIIGPYDDYGWARFFFMIDKGNLPGVPPGKASFCSAREVAAAHMAAYEKGRCGSNYLLGGADASFQELVQEIGRLLNRPVPKRQTPAFLLKIIGRMSEWVSYITRKEPDLTPEKATLVSSELICSSKKAQQELGYKPVSLSVMLQDCHQWLVKEGLLNK